MNDQELKKFVEDVFATHPDLANHVGKLASAVGAELARIGNGICTDLLAVELLVKGLTRHLTQKQKEAHAAVREVLFKDIVYIRVEDLEEALAQPMAERS